MTQERILIPSTPSSKADVIRQLRANILSDEGQVGLIGENGSITRLREELGNKEGWKRASLAADKETEGLNTNIINIIFDRARELGIIDTLEAGHDLGHLYRDFTAAFLIATDPSLPMKQQNAANPHVVLGKGEILAAILAGAFHDIAVGITDRYKDDRLGAPHAEVGAQVFLEITEDLLPENIRKMAAYGIAAHTHALSAKDTGANGIPPHFKREPYIGPSDTMWIEDGRVFNIVVPIARLSDRTDCNGASFIWRHIMAHMGTIGQGREGADRTTDGQYYAIDSESGKKLFTALAPRSREERGSEPATLLEHILVFRDSFRVGSYGGRDGEFPALMTIMQMKVDQTTHFVDEVLAPIEKREIDALLSSETEIIERLKEANRLIALNPANFDIAWETFVEIFGSIDDETRARYLRGFLVTLNDYNNGVKAMGTMLEQYMHTAEEPFVVETAREAQQALREVSIV